MQTVPPAGVTDLPLGTKPSDPTNRSLDAACVPSAQHPLAPSKYPPSPRLPLAPANAAGVSDQTRPTDNASSTDHITDACSVASHDSHAEAPPGRRRPAPGSPRGSTRSRTKLTRHGASATRDPSSDSDSDASAMGRAAPTGLPRHDDANHPTGESPPTANAHAASAWLTAADKNAADSDDGPWDDNDGAADDDSAAAPHLLPSRPKVGDVVRLHGQTTRATVIPPLPGHALPLRVRWHGRMCTESAIAEEDVESVETTETLRLTLPGL